jgi:hypothetical protein
LRRRKNNVVATPIPAKAMLEGSGMGVPIDPINEAIDVGVPAGVVVGSPVSIVKMPE